MAWKPFPWFNKGEVEKTKLNRQNLNAAEEAFATAIGNGEIALPSSVASKGAENTFTVNQSIAASLGSGVFGIGNTPGSAGANGRVPFRSTMTVDSSASGGAENFIPYVINSVFTGDYTSPSPAPTDPGYAWGVDMFTATGEGSKDGNGLGSFSGTLIECAVRSGSGTSMNYVIGANLSAYFYTTHAEAKVERMFSAFVQAPTNLSGAKGVTKTAYGLFVNSVEAGAAGSSEAFAIYVEGGLSSFGGPVLLVENAKHDYLLVAKNTGLATVAKIDQNGIVFGYQIQTNGEKVRLSEVNSGGMLSLFDQTADPPAEVSKALLYSKSQVGEKLFVLPSTGTAIPLDTALWHKSFTLLTPSGAASIRQDGVGAASSTGTLTNVQAVSTAPQMLNIATAASTNAIADVATSGGAGMQVYAGASTDIYAGYEYRATLAFPDASYNAEGASTGSRLLAGLVSSVATAFGGDRGGAAQVAAFMRSNVNGGATDTNWVFVTNTGSTSTATATEMVFTPGHLYKFAIKCVAGGTTIFWSVEDATEGTVKTGSVTATLPVSTTALFTASGVLTINAVSRNFKLARVWLVTDKG